MSNLLFCLIIMVPTSLLFTSIGIYAWRRKKPMWFWAGDTVSEDEITDVRAYNSSKWHHVALFFVTALDRDNCYCVS